MRLEEPLTKKVGEDTEFEAYISTVINSDVEMYRGVIQFENDKFNLYETFGWDYPDFCDTAEEALEMLEQWYDQIVKFIQKVRI